MPAYLIPLIMSVAAAANDKSKRNDQVQVQSATTKYSPWTHLVGQAPTANSPTSDLIQGAAASMAAKQGETTADNANNLNAAQVAYLKGLSTGGGGPQNSAIDQYGNFQGPWSQVYRK